MADQKALPFERVVLTIPHADLARYEEVARRAADAGVTHVTVSALPEKSRWEIDDPADPYLHWSIIHLSLFKVMVPDLLKEWVPAEFARRGMDLIRRRCDVLGRIGVKAALLTYEPMWWPESVFEKHPQLRGPRVDHPRRSRHPRFSPDVTNPRVLDLYRETVERFVREAPGVELFIFSTNDSGTGISWSEHLYNHANGPTYQPFKPFGERLRELLDVCEDGARRAGNNGAEFYIRTLMNPTETDSARMHLRRPDGTTRIAFFGLNPLPKEDALQGLMSAYLYPLKDVGQPLALMRSLDAAAGRGRHGVILNPMAEAFVTEWEGDGPDLEVLKVFLSQRPRGVLAQTQALAGVMERKYGPDWGPRVLQMYWHLDRAMSGLQPMNSGGLLFEIWLLAERWLTRPLVPLPELLTADERSYYRPHQFQAMSEAQADNPLEAQAVQIVSGVHAGRILVPNMLAGVEEEVRLAIAAPAAGPGVAPPADVARLQFRLRALLCMVRCCNNFIQFCTVAEHVRQRVRRDEQGQIIPPAEDNWGNHADREERSTLYNLMRAEIDNTQALIDLIESAPEPVFVTGRTPADEDIFMLSPDLVDQLRRKIRIMLDHWPDMNLILRRPNL